MVGEPRGGGLFPALLKHWRRSRGLSQLDLALTADVSSRHVSFLETGRSQPSEQMVLKLAGALGVPLRHQNEMLSAAGFAPVFDTPSPADLPPNIRDAIERLKTQQEPFPLVVMDRVYNLIDANVAAARLMLNLGADASRAPPTNAIVATYDPAHWQPAIVNFDEVGRALLSRLQREALANPGDQQRRELIEQVLAMPTVDPSWRDVDLSASSQPTLTVELRRGDLELKFFTMMTAMSAPQNVTVEELQIESYFPADASTEEACRVLAGEA